MNEFIFDSNVAFVFALSAAGLLMRMRVFFSCQCFTMQHDCDEETCAPWKFPGPANVTRNNLNDSSALNRVLEQ